MSVYYFYIARCSDKTLYSGITTDILARECKHNDGKGAKYTRGRRPVKIIYSEEFGSRSDALKREAQVKKLSRGQKEDLLKG